MSKVSKAKKLLALGLTIVFIMIPITASAETCYHPDMTSEQMAGIFVMQIETLCSDSTHLECETYENYTLTMYTCPACDLQMIMATYKNTYTVHQTPDGTFIEYH